jgi:hypothetical protein
MQMKVTNGLMQGSSVFGIIGTLCVFIRRFQYGEALSIIVLMAAALLSVHLRTKAVKENDHVREFCWGLGVPSFIAALVLALSALS